MFDIDSLAADPVASEKGVWANFMGARFLIARHNNAQAQYLRSKLTLDHWDQLTGEDKEVADRVAREVEARAASEAILLGWENVSSGGEPIEYTPEVGLKYFADPRFRDLHQFVENFSMHRGNYRERVEADLTEQVKDSAAS